MFSLYSKLTTIQPSSVTYSEILHMAMSYVRNNFFSYMVPQPIECHINSLQQLIQFVFVPYVVCTITSFLKIGLRDIVKILHFLIPLLLFKFWLFGLNTRIAILRFNWALPLNRYHHFLRTKPNLTKKRAKRINDFIFITFKH